MPYVPRGRVIRQPGQLPRAVLLPQIIRPARARPHLHQAITRGKLPPRQIGPLQHARSQRPRARREPVLLLHAQKAPELVPGAGLDRDQRARYDLGADRVGRGRGLRCLHERVAPLDDWVHQVRALEPVVELQLGGQSVVEALAGANTLVEITLA